MKFSHIKAFEKHIESADPKHLSNIYLIVDPEEHVQKKMAQKLILDGESPEQHFADDLTISKYNEIVNSVSMFTARKSVILYRMDKAPKPLLKKILDTCTKLDLSLRIVFCLSSMHKDFAFLNKEGVILDLSMEKPWDREKRLSMTIAEDLRKEGIRISASLSDQIVKMCAAKVSIIDSEVEKLICLLKGKLEVSRSDLRFISSNYEYSIFKVGQSLLEGNLKEALAIIEADGFPMMLLIYSLRSLVQRLYRFKDLRSDEYAEAFPRLKGSFLDKNLKMSQRHSKESLKKILQILFEMELLMKSQQVDESFLSSLLLMKIGAYSEPISV